MVGQCRQPTENGDDNSGWMFVKYPLYSDDESGQLEADYCEIRLPEIITALPNANCAKVTLLRQVVCSTK